MTRWTKAAAAGVAAIITFAAAPGAAEETNAQKKDRTHEEQIDARMKERAREPGKKTMGDRADQAADATRKGGAKAARTWHGATDKTRRGAHRAAQKTEKATD